MRIEGQTDGNIRIDGRTDGNIRLDGQNRSILSQLLKLFNSDQAPVDILNLEKR